MESLYINPKTINAGTGGIYYRNGLIKKEKDLQKNLAKEAELILFFRTMVEICGRATVKENLGALDTTFTFSGAANTLVHQAVESNYLELVNSVLIDEVEFEPDYYTQKARKSLLHTFVRSRDYNKLTEHDRTQIIGLIKRCNNLELKDKDDKTALQLLYETKTERKKKFA